MEKDIVIIKRVTNKFLFSTPGCKKLGHFSGMQNDPLMQRQGLTLSAREPILDVRL